MNLFSPQRPGERSSCCRPKAPGAILTVTRSSPAYVLPLPVCCKQRPLLGCFWFLYSPSKLFVLEIVFVPPNDVSKTTYLFSKPATSSSVQSFQHKVWITWSVETFWIPTLQCASGSGRDKQCSQNMKECVDHPLSQ